MITPRKLMSLPFSTRVRKLERVLAGFVALGTRNARTDRLVLHHLLVAASGDVAMPARLAALAKSLADRIVGDELESVLRGVNELRHALRSELGLETGDWDLVETESETKAGGRVILPHRLYLESVRSPFNVGAIFRAAESFGIAEILVSPDCASPDHPRARRSAMGTVDMVPWKVADLDKAAPRGSLFLLETGGADVAAFAFPEAGTMVVGSEELGASPEARNEAARSGGVVSVETGGRKGSLNVSVAVGIVAHAWFLGASGRSYR